MYLQEHPNVLVYTATCEDLKYITEFSFIKLVSSIFSGLNIAQSNFGAFQAVASIFVFSISSPIGIGIGMVLVNMEKSLAGDIANGILQVSYNTLLKEIIIISG